MDGLSLFARLASITCKVRPVQSMERDHHVTIREGKERKGIPKVSATHLRRHTFDAQIVLITNLKSAALQASLIHRTDHVYSKFKLISSIDWDDSYSNSYWSHNEPEINCSFKQD